MTSDTRNIPAHRSVEILASKLRRRSVVLFTPSDLWLISGQADRRFKNHSFGNPPSIETSHYKGQVLKP